LKKKVIVVDLDGTLYTINTFHYFIKFLIGYCMKNFNVALLLKIVLAATARLLKMTTHSQMKYAILKSIATIKDIDYSSFVDQISSKKRNILVLNDLDFDTKILATAAPSCYADIIAKREMFDVCLATEFLASGFDKEFENMREVKKDSVLNYLSSIGLSEIDILVTDHIDDLPLMKLAKRNILVSPSIELKSQLEQHQIYYETIQ
jgi:phosphoserine phosphatase